MTVKRLRDQVDFLFADKHQSFLQVSALASGGCGQACPKHPKYQVCNIFVIFQETVTDKYDFLHEDKHQSFLQASSIVFTGHIQACPVYPK